MAKSPLIPLPLFASNTTWKSSYSFKEKAAGLHKLPCSPDIDQIGLADN